MGEPTELETRWEHEIAKEDARAFADELLSLATTALEEVQVSVGRRVWERACEGREDRVENAPLVEAVADVEPLLSRATMYRAVAVYRQSLHLPEETRGRLGPSRLYALLRLPNDHIEKKALARRAALSAMPLDDLVDEIDTILGVQRRDPRGAGLATRMSNAARSLGALRKQTASFVPRNQKDLDKRRKQAAAMLADAQAVVDELARVVVPPA